MYGERGLGDVLQEIEIERARRRAHHDPHFERLPSEPRTLRNLLIALADWLLYGVFLAAGLGMCLMAYTFVDRADEIGVPGLVGALIAFVVVAFGFLFAVRERYAPDQNVGHRTAILLTLTIACIVLVVAWGAILSATH